MIHQYHAQRFHRLPTGRCVGTVPVGTILYIQDGIRPFAPIRWPIKREPWIVTAWLNREYFPGVKGAPRVKMLASGHLAEVRSLRDGRQKLVADWILLRCLDAGLERL
jgi:hypothetical protein